MDHNSTAKHTPADGPLHLTEVSAFAPLVERLAVSADAAMCVHASVFVVALSLSLDRLCLVLGSDSAD